MTDRPDEARSMDEPEEVEELEDAELDDAELDDVAGGVAQYSTTSKSSSSSVGIAFPDVCKTPSPPAPIAMPYPDRTLA